MQSVVPAPASRLGNLLLAANAWNFQEGFHQPDWQKIAEIIENRALTEQDQEAAWHDASLQWLHRLRTEMGDGFRLGESRHFLLVSSKPNRPFQYYLDQSERALMYLRARLGEAAWRWEHGKHAILMFDDEEAYYRYISHFYPEEGEFGTSRGVCLYNGYCHMALAPQQHVLPTLFHEMTHLCLSRQQLPLWLEEGLSMHLASDLAGHGVRGVDKEFILEQRSFWKPTNIQRFWSGESFVSGEESKYSYGLAENLVALLSREFRDLGPFILAARAGDAGQAAARQRLDVDLNDVAAAFLGEGDWEPRPPKPQGS